MAKGIKNIPVEDDSDDKTNNVNTPLINKMLIKQLEQALKISVLENKLSDLQKNVEVLKSGVSRILQYMENDPNTGQQGFVARLNDVEHRVDGHDHFKNNFEGKVWGLGAAGGLLSAFIMFVLEKVLNK